MIKKSVYPKTTRMKIKNSVVITEKLDGSNLGIFKKGDDLFITTRENIVKFSDIDKAEDKEIITNYKGLYAWLKAHGHDLIEKLYDGSGFFGEWMSKSALKYPQEIIDGRFYVFAKARLTDDLEAEKINYDHELFIYPFIDQQIPEYIHLVPVVARVDKVPTIDELNDLYDLYSQKIVCRNVEGFVISYYGTVRKYVRMKHGKLEDHHE